MEGNLNMSRNEQISVSESEQIVQITLSGQFVGGEETAAVRAALLEFRHDGRDIIIDMRNVSYVNSSFLGTLLAGQTALSRVGGRIVVSGLNDSLKRVFTTTQLDRLISIHESAEQAIAALQPDTKKM